MRTLLLGAGAHLALLTAWSSVVHADANAFGITPSASSQVGFQREATLRQNELVRPRVAQSYFASETPSTFGDRRLRVNRSRALSEPAAPPINFERKVVYPRYRRLENVLHRFQEAGKLRPVASGVKLETRVLDSSGRPVRAIVFLAKAGKNARELLEAFESGDVGEDHFVSNVAGFAVTRADGAVQIPHLPRGTKLSGVVLVVDYPPTTFNLNVRPSDPDKVSMYPLKVTWPTNIP